jgi:hypothetical protein
MSVRHSSQQSIFKTPQCRSKKVGTECQYYSCEKKPPRSQPRTNITVSNMVAFVAVYLTLWEEILMLFNPHLCFILVLCLKLNHAS